MKRNGDMGPKTLWRVSTFGRNYDDHWIAMLMGKSNREVLDGATREPDIPQILFMMNGLGVPDDALVVGKLGAAASQKEKMEVLWKAILGRLPTKAEEPLFGNPPEDVMWALINSNEFRFGR